MGSVRAPFTSLQAQAISAGHFLSAGHAGPRAALAPIWPDCTAAGLPRAWPQHAVQVCPLFCYCLRKGWSPSPCHSHPYSGTIPFPDPGYYNCRHQNFPIYAYVLKAPVNSYQHTILPATHKDLHPHPQLSLRRSTTDGSDRNIFSTLCLLFIRKLLFLYLLFPP